MLVGWHSLYFLLYFVAEPRERERVRVEDIERRHRRDRRAEV